MGQQRLDRYFTTIRPRQHYPTPDPIPRITLLDLPSSVRAIIYRCAGLSPHGGNEDFRMVMNPSGAESGWCQVSETPIAHCRPETRGPWCNHTDEIECFYFCHYNGEEQWSRRLEAQYPLLLSLLSTCRLIYKEATRLLYSTSRLEVIYTAPGGFAPLHQLGPIAMASLRDLTIRMNSCFCIEGPRCGRLSGHLVPECSVLCRTGGHDRPFGRRLGVGTYTDVNARPFGKQAFSRRDRQAVKDLRELCAKLARFIPPNQLKLQFACEVECEDLAAEFMTSLEELPTLRSCAIFLAKQPWPDLCEIASTTQIRLTNPAYDHSKHFRFRDLPQEVQLEILRHAGVVAPFHVEYSPWSNAPNRAFTRCLYQYEISGYSGDMPIGCCCDSAMHSSAAWVCPHWHFPHALFLVDKKMEADARSLMYAENIWTVRHLTHLVPSQGTKRFTTQKLPPFWNNEGAPYPLTPRMKGNVSRFLENVRVLQLTIPYDLPQPYHRDEWLAEVEQLLQYCVPEKLDLTVVLHHPEHDVHVDLNEYSAFFWRAEEQMRMLDSLAAGLRGQRPRKLTIKVLRGHFKGFDKFGSTDQFVCDISGVVADRWEMQLERRFLNQGPLSDAEDTRAPVTIHGGTETPFGHECQICGTVEVEASQQEDRLAFPHPYSLFFYHR